MSATVDKPVEPTKAEDKAGSPNKEPREPKKKYIEKGDNAAKKTGENTEEGHKHRAEKQKKEGEGDKEHKGEKKDKPHRERRHRERKEHEEYNYDASLITEQTKIPKLPKKNELKEKPDDKVFKQRQADIQARIQVLVEKRKKIIAEKFEREKKGPAAKQGERTVFDEFEHEKTEIIKMREEYRTCLDQINDFKDKIEKAKEELKDLDEEIRAIDKSKKGDTKQNIFEKLRQMEHQLLTAQLSYKQERDLNNQIDALRRLITGAESNDNLEVKLEKLRLEREQKQQEIDDLYKEKHVFNEKYNPIKEKLDKKSKEIDALKEECNKRKDEQKQFKEGVQKEREDFYEKRSQRIDQVSEEIEKLRDSKDAIWDQFHSKMDEFYEQSNYIKFIEWQMKQQKRLVDKKEYEERKKKRQEREKEEQAKAKASVSKYNNEMSTCDMLIEYCQRLRPAVLQQAVSVKAPEISKEDLEAQLRSDKNWAKQKGFTVIESKKSKDEDEMVQRKGKKKNKNVEAKKDEKKPTNFSHDLSVMNYFDLVKVMLPMKQEDLDKVIGELKDKKAHYVKLSEEEEKPVEVEKKEEAVVAS